MYDGPHLLKSIRNNLSKCDFCVGGKIVSFKHIEALYILESTKVTGLKLTPKLVQRHISITAFSKMKVKLVAQVFSHRVHAALLTLVCKNNLPPEG